MRLVCWNGRGRTEGQKVVFGFSGKWCFIQMLESTDNLKEGYMVSGWAKENKIDAE